MLMGVMLGIMIGLMPGSDDGVDDGGDDRGTRVMMGLMMAVMMGVLIAVMREVGMGTVLAVMVEGSLGDEVMMTVKEVHKEGMWLVEIEAWKGAVMIEGPLRKGKTGRSVSTTKLGQHTAVLTFESDTQSLKEFSLVTACSKLCPGSASDCWLAPPD